MKNKFWKRCVASGLVPFMAASMLLSGCGDKDGAGKDGAGNTGNATSANAEENDPGAVDSPYGYEPSFSDMSGADFYQITMVGDAVYGIASNYNEDTQEYASWLESRNLKTGELISKIDVSNMVEVPEADKTIYGENPQVGVSLSSYAVKQDGSVLILANTYMADADYENYTTSLYMLLLDPQGNLVSSKNLDEVMKQLGDAYPDKMLYTKDDKILISCDESIILFDDAFNMEGKISVGSWINSLFETEDGSIYAAYYSRDSYGVELSKVDIEKGKLGENMANLPDSNYIFAGADNKLLCSDRTFLYLYDMKTQTSEKVLNWSDCNLVGDYIQAVASLEDGNYAAISNDWNVDETSLVILNRKLRSEMTEKTTLSIAMMYASQDLQQAVVAFNKSQDEYKVSIKEYADYSSDTDWSDLEKQFVNSVTGSNPPDMVSLSDLDVQMLLSKKLLVDIGKYLDQSSTIKRSDYMSALLDCYTYDGVLVGIPYSFNIQTMVGSKADLGDEEGWTLFELIAYDKAHPKADLTNYASREMTMEYCMAFTLDYFLDVEKKEVNFDCPEFKELLEYLKGFAEEFNYEDRMESTPTRIEKGEILLENAYIGSIQAIQEYAAPFHDGANFIGYPTIDGTPAHILEGSDVYGILSSSKNQEAAWKFLEFYLSREQNNAFSSWGIPSSISAFNKSAQEELKKAGQSSNSSVSYEDDWTYNYHYCTQEEIDTLNNLIAHSRISTKYNEEIMNMVLEEAEAYFQNQKSVDEVAKVIQSRVAIYINEND